MKKLVLSLFFFLATLYSFSQETLQTESCQFKESVRDIISTTDSLQRMIKKLKSTLTVSQWSDFYQDVSTGIGLSSFDRCGVYNNEFRYEYISIGQELDRTLGKLKNLIDPSNTLSGAGLRSRMNAEFDCYFNDNAENSLANLRSDAGLSDLGRFGGGPCEIAMRTCMRDEKRNYNASIRECAGIGLGAGALLTGWWGLGAGMACGIAAGNEYFDGVLTCAANYGDCIH